MHYDKPCDFIGNKCNNGGLNKVIIDNILTGNRDFIFPDYCVFIANSIESSTSSSANNKNDFSAICDSMLSWENSELKAELKLSRAKIETLLSKLSVSNSKVDALTECLQEEISEKK